MALAQGSSATTLPSILQLSLGAPAESGRSHLSFALEEHGIGVETFHLPRGRKPALIAGVLRNAPSFSDYAAVVATEYTLAFAAGLRSILTRSQTPVIALGLNLSGSVIRTNAPLLGSLCDMPFRRLALTVVHSRREMGLFQELHHISDDRMAFAHWGFDLPEYDNLRFSDRGPYVCMVGRNNRDFKTFCDAVAIAGINGVIIAPSYAQFDFDVPPSVEIYRDLPFADCLSCIQHSIANLILVKDDARGAGHITAVASMLLGAPQIYTKAEVISDYLVDGVTALAVPLGDAEAVANAIRRVREGGEAIRAMAQKAKSYAERWLSHKTTAGRQADLIVSAIRRVPFAAVDPQWQSAFDELVGGDQ